MKTAHTIEQWPVTRLVPYDRNARTHSEAQVAQIAASITQFGFNNPILVDSSSGIIAGHGRLQAARKLGLASVPVIVLDHLTDAQRRAYILADNKLALNAGWDEELLLAELRDLDEMIDLQLTGFDANELERLFATDEDDARADECPDAPETPVARRGDLWVLGRHRVLCGDATSADDVARLMDGKRANVMLTDPPYGVNLDQSWRDEALAGRSLGPGNRNVVAADDRADWYDAWVLFTGDVVYIWHASAFTDVVKQSLERASFEVKQQIVWNKSIMVMGRSDYHWKHEPCWYAIRKGKAHSWKGDRTQVTVWDAVPPNHIMGGSTEDKTDHPTQKPVALYQIPIRNHTDPGELIYDPFGGSGTAAIACEKTNRAARLMELEPKYCDVIVKRWQDYTGQAATLDGDGRTFAAVAESNR